MALYMFLEEKLKETGNSRLTGSAIMNEMGDCPMKSSSTSITAEKPHR
jgi:hypothetical protein